MLLFYLAWYLGVNTRTVLHYHNSSLSCCLQSDIDWLTNWQRVFTWWYGSMV